MPFGSPSMCSDYPPYYHTWSEEKKAKWDKQKKDDDDDEKEKWEGFKGYCSRT